MREGQLVGGHWDGIVGKSQTSHILGKRQLTYWSKDQPLSALKKNCCTVKNYNPIDLHRMNRHIFSFGK